MAGLISLILLWESAEKYSALPVSDIRIDANKQKNELLTGMTETLKNIDIAAMNRKIKTGLALQQHA